MTLRGEWGVVSELAVFAGEGGFCRPVAVPPDLAALHGPRHGLVSLPLSVYASGAGPERRFDVDEDDQLVGLYEVVLSDANTVEEVCSLVDGEQLRRLWPRLWLPGYVRRAWSVHFPVSAAAR